MGKAMTCYIGDREYRTKAARRQAVQEVLRSYGAGKNVDDPEHHALLRDLLAMHPQAAAKAKDGVTRFRVRPDEYGRAGFVIVRHDGTELGFSFDECLDRPSELVRVRDALRVEIRDCNSAYFTARQDAGTLVSDISGRRLDPRNTEVSYFRGPPFKHIAAAFAAAVGGWSQIQLTDSAAEGTARLVDRGLAERWHEYHRQHAVLGLRHPGER